MAAETRKCLTPETLRRRPDVFQVFRDSEIDVYLPKACLGLGSFAQVYRVVDTRGPGQPALAMKISMSGVQSFRSAWQDGEFLRRVHQADPDAAKDVFPVIHASFRYQDHFCLIVDLCSSTLLTVIQRSAPIAPSQVLRCARQLVTALTILKRANVIHTDIKPENVVFPHPAAPSQTIKLIDFGSARYGTTPTGDTAQTIFYRAPEVVLLHDWTFSVDMWSVGCVLAEMVLKSPIFPGQNSIQLMWAFQQLLGPVPPELRPRRETPDFWTENGDLIPESDWCAMQTEESEQDDYWSRTPDIKSVRDAIERAAGRAWRRNAPFYENLVAFLERIFVYDPAARISPEEALEHPFLQMDVDALEAN
jgi:serine/threonine protein kinase